MSTGVKYNFTDNKAADTGLLYRDKRQHTTMIKITIASFFLTLLSTIRINKKAIIMSSNTI